MGSIGLTKGAYLPLGTKVTEKKLNDTKIPLASSARGAASAETLIIGSGRMATQFRYALEKLKVPYSIWLRSEGAFTLGGKTQKAKRVLLLLPDKALSSFVDDHAPFLRDKILIHFSASHRDPRILGFHPLGTFNREQEIDFNEVAFHGVHPESLFREALPYLTNNYSQLSEEQMQSYHALCVVGANFSAVLWNAFFKEMKNLGVSESAAKNYFKMFAANVARNPSAAITGPLVRNDHRTIEKNISALENKKELQAIYKAFVQVFSNSEYLK